MSAEINNIEYSYTPTTLTIERASLKGTNDAVYIDVVFSTDDLSVPISFGSTDEQISATFGSVQEIHIGNPYTGDYSVTPSESEQILETATLVMEDNITIAPIPNNYGLITWDGRTLTVS